MNAFSYVFIELDKFDVNNYNKSIISDNEKDWLTFMKTQDINKTYKNEQVNSAVKYVDNIKANKYEEYLRHQMSEMAAMKEIESAEQKGRKDGLYEGKIEIARNLLSMELDVDTISKATGLKNEEVAILKKKK